MATGYGLDDNILAAYHFLIANYEKDDQVFLFGFSRGAYTVRVLAGFLHIVGLLDKAQSNLSEYALIAYKEAAEQNDFEIAWRFQRVTQAKQIPIKFIGVWDTVSSVIAPKLSRLYVPQLLSLPYTRTNPLVEIFRHARAIDERRRMFRLNRWAEPQEYLPNPFDPAGLVPQNIKQVWFCGDHSDVGGGYPEEESGIAKLPLSWMVEEAKSHGLLINTAMYNNIVLGQPRQGATREYVPPNIRAPLHNSMTAGWKVLEWFPKAVSQREWLSRKAILGYYLPRREPRFVADGDLVHRSVFERVAAIPEYRPENLPAEDRVKIEP